MRKSLYIILPLLLVFVQSTYGQRREKNIDFDWYFHLGDVDGGESSATDYSSWRLLDVPHDWSIEGEYAKDNPGEGRLGFLPTGIGWYKKELGWDEEWKDKCVYIEFDGIFMNSTIWVNGWKVGYRPNGYIGIGYDITDYLEPGARNVVTVKVDNSLQPAARWYTGSGIYRHVNLIITDKVHIARNGTFVTTPEISASSAKVKVKAEIRNLSGEKREVLLVSVVKDSEGNEVARSIEKKVKLNDNIQFPYKYTVVEDELEVKGAKLWSPANPAVYYLHTLITSGGTILDDYATRFGIRHLDYDSKKGFALNGEPTKLKGVCIHQSTGALGTALNYDYWHKRLTQLKQMGCNAIRTAHYAYAPEFYAMCDTMGFMVMDELFDGWYRWEGAGKAQYDYGHYFLDWWERDLEDFIRRDRNHPSIVMWSLGNEVWGWDRHQYLQYLLNKKFHDMDGTRPTTQAWALGTHIDIAGFNGNGELKNHLSDFHKAKPQKLSVGTEIPHTRSTRGVYRSLGSYSAWIGPEKISEADTKRLFPVDSYTDEEVFPEFDKRYASSYDNQTRRITVREQWKQTRDNDFFIGEFRWTAFDYLGESWGWPARTNNYGIIDLAGFPKDNYYLYQSLWSDKPMVHMLPHWTWPGKEGVEIPVVVYTNGDTAELIVNGKSMGKKAITSNELQAVWLVPYKAGTITAVGYKGGKAIARVSHKTAFEPAAVKLRTDRTHMSPNRSDMVCIEVDIVDSRGVTVPHADNRVTFEVSGPYKLLGVENGDILDTEFQKSLSRRAFMGKALLMLQSTSEPGTLKIKATSSGLKQGAAVVTIK